MVWSVCRERIVIFFVCHCSPIATLESSRSRLRRRSSSIPSSQSPSVRRSPTTTSSPSRKTKSLACVVRLNVAALSTKTTFQGRQVDLEWTSANPLLYFHLMSLIVQILCSFSFLVSFLWSFNPSHLPTYIVMPSPYHLCTKEPPQ